MPRVRHSVLNVNGRYIDISELHKQADISKLRKGMIESQQIHWDYVENIGKRKIILDWKRIVRGKFPILMIKKKKKVSVVS